MAQTPLSQQHVELSRLTTLGVGGRCDSLDMPMSEAEAVESIRDAQSQGQALTVIGGGSNLLVADSGVPGRLLQSADYTFEVTHEGDQVRIDAGAGVEWDELVAFAVSEGFSGVECMSGIPGTVGAAPVQNIGAYGQSLSDRLISLRSVSLQSGDARELLADKCGFGYRSSHFKTAWRGEQFVSRVSLQLSRGPAAFPRNAELREMLGWQEGDTAPPVSTIREAVLKIRRRKSMLIDPADPNSRSAGSFFINPVVDAAGLDRVLAGLADLELEPGDLPRYEVAGGYRLPAAWLIENVGFERGFAFGNAGLSTKHCLALINRGSARATDLIALASIIRRRVRNSFGLTLEPEPVFLGFDRSVEELLG